MRNGGWRSGQSDQKYLRYLECRLDLGPILQSKKETKFNLDYIHLGFVLLHMVERLLILQYVHIIITYILRLRQLGWWVEMR